MSFNGETVILELYYKDIDVHSSAFFNKKFQSLHCRLLFFVAVYFNVLASFKCVTTVSMKNQFETAQYQLLNWILWKKYFSSLEYSRLHSSSIKNKISEADSNGRNNSQQTMTTVIRVCMKIKENCLLKGPLGVSRTEHYLLPFFKVPYDAQRISTWVLTVKQWF